jgi:putative transposase
VTVRYAFIVDEEGNHDVTDMCLWSDVSRSGYYDWKTRKPSATARRREILEAEVRFAFEHSDGTYGYRRVHAWLARRGTAVDPETVRVIMRELDLVPCQPRPWRPVTTIAGDAGNLPDLVRRDFTADAPARKLVGDITYIRTWEGMAVSGDRARLFLEEGGRLCDGRTHARRIGVRRAAHGSP